MRGLQIRDFATGDYTNVATSLNCIELRDLINDIRETMAGYVWRLFCNCWLTQVKSASIDHCFHSFELNLTETESHSQKSQSAYHQYCWLQSACHQESPKENFSADFHVASQSSQICLGGTCIGEWHDKCMPMSLSNWHFLVDICICVCHWIYDIGK